MAAEPRPGPKPVDVRVGSRVAIRRRERGLTLPDAATALGITEAELTAREQGKVRFEAMQLYTLATLLDIRPGWFFEGLNVAVMDTPFED